MPRKNLIRSEFFPYHVVNQVNNREWFRLPPSEMWEILSDNCFEISLICGARIHGFVMMSNHFHMIVSSPVCDLGVIMKQFSSFVTRTYNLKSGRIGHLFKGRYRWSLIDSPLYYAHALKYVYRNPVKAGLCNQVEEYPFSTLHGILGRNRLPFPVNTIASEQFPLNLVPEQTDELLRWLNTPFRNEESEIIRKAFRRKIFQIPRRRNVRKLSPLESELR
jgi:REP element-mobilizing transposase RayT